jgi:hypothetical protein
MKVREEDKTRHECCVCMDNLVSTYAFGKFYCQLCTGVGVHFHDTRRETFRNLRDNELKAKTVCNFRSQLHSDILATKWKRKKYFCDECVTHQIEYRKKNGYFYVDIA